MTPCPTSVASRTVSSAHGPRRVRYQRQRGRVFLFVACAFAMLMPLVGNAQPPAAFQTAYATFLSAQPDWYRGPSSAAERAAAAYAAQIAPFQDTATRRRMHTADLRSLFDATYVATFYTSAAANLADMRADYALLVDRQAVTQREQAHLYEMLVQTRALDEARRFLRDHPGASSRPLPRVQDLRAEERHGRAVLHVAPDGQSLEVRNAAFDADLQVVVVAHPLCHFTAYAVHDIEADPALREVMRAHSIWIAPQDGHLDVATFSRWAGSHPAFPIAIAWRQREWPGIDYWGTPGFYVFQHGQVVAQHVGWAHANSASDLAALRAALARVGLLAR